MADLPTISPERASGLIRQGAVLVDIREADEHLREHIPGARHHALSQLDRRNPAQPGDDVLVFHCRSGARTRANTPQLRAAAGSCEAYILEGGIEARKRAGLPTAVNTRQPIEMNRQVQIAAGSLVLAGVVLGIVVSPIFYALSGIVGAGLVFAGISGTCGMAHALALLPWNRRAAT